jgi:hypothetical protein
MGGNMGADMGKATAGMPGNHSQNDMSKHTSKEMEQCRKANMPILKDSVGYATDKGPGGGMGKMGGM